MTSAHVENGQSREASLIESEDSWREASHTIDTVIGAAEWLARAGYQIRMSIEGEGWHQDPFKNYLVQFFVNHW